jgi:hypothetical protein
MLAHASEIVGELPAVKITTNKIKKPQPQGVGDMGPPVHVDPHRYALPRCTPTHSSHRESRLEGGYVFLVSFLCFFSFLFVSFSFFFVLEPK